jgi:hypothetical protein
MTFTEIQTKILNYAGLSSTEATTRIGKAINAQYRRVTARLGMDTTRFVTRSAATADGVRTLTFTSIEKIDRIIDVTGDVRLLQEVSMHDLRSIEPAEGEPSRWAVQNTGADSVTVVFDTIPDAAYSLQADGITSLSDLSGTDEPAFAESFHDILAWFVISEELLKKEKDKLAQTYERKAEQLLADLVFQHADSPTRVTRQADTSVSASSGTTSGGAVSESLTFLQTGSGAVLRTVQAKLRNVERSIMDFNASPSNTAAENKLCIDAAFAATARGATLWIDEGEFNVNGPLIRHQDGLTVDNASIHLRGHGKSSVLRCMNNENLLQFTAEEGDNVTAGWSMRDFLLTYNAGTTSGSALYLRHWHRGLVENVYVNGAPTASLRLAQCIVNTFVNFVTVSGFDIGGAIAPRPTYGILIEDHLGVASNANTFIGGEVGASTGGAGFGVYLDGTGRGNRFYNTVIEANDTGIFVGANHLDWVFEGCWLEANTLDFDIDNGQGILRTSGDAARRAVCTYRARGVSNADQTTATTIAEDVEFQTNQYNVGYSGEIHNVGTTPARFVAPVAGLYTLSANVVWEGNATGVRTTAFVKNGLTTLAQSIQAAVVASSITQALTVDVLLAKDDYVTVNVTQTSGGDLDVLSGSSCSIRWVAEEFTT